jgi:predicted transcriptional regulator
MLTAKDIMTQKIVSVPLELPVEKLAAVFLDNKISGAPVVDDDGQLIGVVTESDLIDQTKNLHIPTVVSILDSFLFLESPNKMDEEIKKMAGRNVGDICTKKPTVVQTETPLSDVATIMAEKNLHTLPVMEDNRLVGVIGKSDIIRTLIQG